MILFYAIFINSLNLFNKNIINLTSPFIITFIDNLNINYCFFYNCHSNSKGGAIFYDKTENNLTILNSLFKKCTTYEMGGGIYSICKINYILKSCFETCYHSLIQSLKNGAAGTLTSSLEGHLNDSIITKCAPYGYNTGYIALCFFNGLIHSKNNNITYNDGNLFCGLQFYNPSNLIIEYLLFYNNYRHDSLTLYFCSKSIKFQYCNFINNNGAIYLAEVNLNLLNFYFINNLNDFVIASNSIINLNSCFTDKNSFLPNGLKIDCYYLTNTFYNLNQLPNFKICINIYFKTNFFEKRIINYLFYLLIFNVQTH